MTVNLPTKKAVKSTVGAICGQESKLRHVILRH